MWKKLWKLILVIIIIIIAIYFPVILLYVGEALASAGFAGMAAATIAFAATVPWWVGAVVGLGLAYIVDPDTTSEIIANVGEVVGDVTGAIGGVAGDALTAFLSKVWPLALGGLAAWYILRDPKPDASAPKNQDVLANEKGEIPSAYKSQL